MFAADIIISPFQVNCDTIIVRIVQYNAQKKIKRNFLRVAIDKTRASWYFNGVQYKGQQMHDIKQTLSHIIHATKALWFSIFETQRFFCILKGGFYYEIKGHRTYQGAAEGKSK